jgi:hypothetical protein
MRYLPLLLLGSALAVLTQPGPKRRAPRGTRSAGTPMFDRYNNVSEDDLRMAAQKTTLYVDTLPVKRAPG